MPSSHSFVRGEKILPVQTNPQHRLDRTGLRYFLRWLGFRKDSRGWDWQPYPKWEGLARLPEFYTVVVPGDPSAGKRRGLLSTIINTNRWKKVAILEVNNQGELYHIGFIAREHRGIFAEWCSVVLSGSKVAVGVGPYETRFFAIPDKDICGVQIPMEINFVEFTTKKELSEDIPLL